MASIKKKSGGGGGANWMDTYGDMVTLLLCFFVLLYSISTIDAEKWMIVVRSFNRDAMVNEPENPPGPALIIRIAPAATVCPPCQRWKRT